MQTMPAMSSTLQNEITTLTEKLAPSGADEVAKCINALLDAGFMVPASVNEAEAIDLYRDALSATAIAGLRKAFVKLKRGEYANHRSFMPTPAEMAALANAEARGLREDRARASELARTVRENAALGGPHMSRYGLKDLRITQEERARELAAQGFVFVAECQSHDEFANGCKKRRWPLGATHLWAINQVWAPALVKPSAPEVQADAA